MAQTTFETDESHDLISADKVDGTTVYGADGDKIGSIKTVMIDKRGGQVPYAVLSAGGFLGIGEEYHQVPWSKLHYDEKLHGYRIDVTEDQLRGAPHFKANEYRKATSRENEKRVYDYYGVPPYWM
jgi:sporulation protein YlmC with PRC-barrel domain